MMSSAGPGLPGAPNHAELGSPGLRTAPLEGAADRLTSPVEVWREVRRLSPEPQELWLFHTMSEGGLWVTPAPEAQICSEREMGAKGKRSRCAAQAGGACLFRGLCEAPAPCPENPLSPARAQA